MNGEICCSGQEAPSRRIVWASRRALRRCERLMFVRSVYLDGFRELSFPPGGVSDGVNVIIGRKCPGKDESVGGRFLPEAAAVPYRTISDREVIRHDAQSALVRAEAFFRRARTAA